MKDNRILFYIDVLEKKDVGDLEITPVSAAIANYLGIDLSPEGRAARNRRGISIVVHGAPFSGKTATAIALAKMYNAALLTVDGVVTEAIEQGTTTAGREGNFTSDCDQSTNQSIDR